MTFAVTKMTFHGHVLSSGSESRRSISAGEVLIPVMKMEPIEFLSVGSGDFTVM